MSNYYTNVPTRRRKGEGVLLVNQLPTEYVVMKNGSASAHIVHKMNVREHVGLVAGICGRDTAKTVSGNRISLSLLCLDCLVKMDEIMEGYFYDQKTDEWYDPTKRSEHF